MFTQAQFVLMAPDGTLFLLLAVWMANILISGLEYFNTDTRRGAKTSKQSLVHPYGITLGPIGCQ